MMIRAKLAAIKGIRPHEWALRFCFGGAICVLAGLVAKLYGPELGGLFLAFPAIFPAGATLVEAHEKRHKARVGVNGTHRGRVVAGIDAAGTSIGCFGLGAFALLCWRMLPHFALWQVFVLSTLAWFVVSAALWRLRKSRMLRTRMAQREKIHAFRSS